MENFLVALFVPLLALTLVLGVLVLRRKKPEIEYLPAPPEEPSAAAELARSKQLLDNMLNLLAGKVEHYARDVRHYNHSLEQHRTAIEQATSMRSIRDIERLLVEEVDSMRRANETYRSQLEEANRTIQEQRKQLDELSVDALMDFLTQIPNRRAFDKRLHEEIERFRRGGPVFALVLMDIDRFKDINDTHGHSAGDEVLRRVASVLEGNKRITDFAARYGGEEFALILPSTGEHESRALAEKLRERVEALPIFFGPTRLAVTFSAGVAEMLAADKGTATLIQRADERLYRAKTSGRNQVVS